MRCMYCGHLVTELHSEPGTWMHTLSWRRRCINEEGVATPEREDLPLHMTEDS